MHMFIKSFRISDCLMTIVSPLKRNQYHYQSLPEWAEPSGYISGRFVIGSSDLGWTIPLILFSIQSLN